MNYCLKTISGRKHRLSAAEYGLLSEYNTAKKNRFYKPVCSLLLGTACLLTTNLSAIGNSEILEQRSFALEKNSTEQLVLKSKQVIDQTNHLWVQIELTAP